MHLRIIAIAWTQFENKL